MEQELKDRWVAALRSGDYLQATEYLRSDTGYCCLGVLCDISRVGSWGEREEAFEYILPGEGGALLQELGDFMDALEMKVADHTKLIEMNDDENKNFEEIADWIEQNV